MVIDTADHPTVKIVMNVMINLGHQLYIEHRGKKYVFVHLILNGSNLDYVDHTGNKRSVSSKIKEMTLLPTARWLNHLMFDSNTIQGSFKQYLINNHGLNFT